jgi:hypothetical protein
MEEVKVPSQEVHDTSKAPVADISTGEVISDIYIDPEDERKALRKFDIYVFPVSVIFIVLASLDRNNVRLLFVRLQC